MLKLPSRPKLVPASIEFVVDHKPHYSDIFINMLQQPNLKPDDIERIARNLTNEAYSKGFRDGSLVNDITDEGERHIRRKFDK